MSETGRRLAAIMFTDMVGFTALTQTDESLTLELLEKQNEVLRPIFQSHRGREVKTIGDAFLVEFDSALDATLCAIEIQTTLHGHNSSSPEEGKIRLRVGIHLGDVAHRQNDVFGDAVNIASRIEPLAEAEGVCISQQVFDQVRNKIKNPLVKLGQRELKGVQFPIDVYKVAMPWEGIFQQAPQAQAETGRRIAVLPFTNMSPDPKDEYFADGMTEELISTLSKIAELKVISRTSVMRYKGTTRSLGEISRELGVGSILEGSIRKSADDLRITVQLIDSKKDEHLWSQDFDRKMENVFALQREIAGSVAKALEANLLPKEAARIGVKETENPTAYAYFLQGRQLLHRGTETSLRQSLDFLGRATDMEPSFARAYVAMAESHLALANSGYEPFEESVGKAEGLVGKALQLNPESADAHATLCLIRYMEDQMDAAELEAKKAIQSSPSLADAYLNLSHVRAVKGHLSEAVKLVETAYQLDPLTPRVIGLVGHLYFYQGRDAEAMAHWKRTLQLAPFITYLHLAEYHICKGEFAEAEEAARMLEKLNPTDRRSIQMRGYLDATIGRRDEALGAIKRLEQSPEGSTTVNALGFIYYALGEKDSFFECMFKSVEMHALNAIMLRYSPLFSDIRTDPRFDQLFAKIGIGTIFKPGDEVVN